MNWALGPIGLMALMVLITGVAWPWLRRSRSHHRRRVVRVAVVVLLVVAVALIWAIPLPNTPGRLLIGRHAWFEVLNADPGGSAARMRFVGPNVIASLVETGMVVLVALGIEHGIHRRLADRDAGRCDRCGYDLRRIASDQCPECGRRRKAEDAEPPAADSASTTIPRTPPPPSSVRSALTAFDRTRSPQPRRASGFSP
jgi:hypothetical protein